MIKKIKQWWLEYRQQKCQHFFVFNCCKTIYKWNTRYNSYDVPTYELITNCCLCNKEKITKSITKIQ